MAVTGASLKTALGVNMLACAICVATFSVLRVYPLTKKFFAPKQCVYHAIRTACESRFIFPLVSPPPRSPFALRNCITAQTMR